MTDIDTCLQVLVVSGPVQPSVDPMSDWSDSALHQYQTNKKFIDRNNDFFSILNLYFDSLTLRYFIFVFLWSDTGPAHCQTTPMLDRHWAERAHLLLVLRTT